MSRKVSHYAFSLHDIASFSQLTRKLTPKELRSIGVVGRKIRGGQHYTLEEARQILAFVYARHGTHLLTKALGPRLAHQGWEPGRRIGERPPPEQARGG